jgi:CHASE2 domain-containing sensor protein
MSGKKWNYLWLDALLCTVFSFIISGILYLVVINMSILDPFTKAFTDFNFTDIYFSKFLDKNVSNDVVIVNVKHEDRYQIAQAIEKVARQNPKSIGLDIIFKELKSSYVDSILKKSFEDQDNLVFSFYNDNGEQIRNHAYFDTKTKDEGFINVNLLNQDVTIRNFLGVSENTFSFATKVAIKSGFIDNEEAKVKLNLETPINYFGGLDSFLHFDIEDILLAKSIQAMKNKIVLFGYLGEPAGNIYDIEDKQFTPLNSKIIGRSAPDTFGVIVHANILQMLIQNNFISKVPLFISYSIAFILCFFITLLGLRIHKKNELVFDLSVKFSQLIISIILLYISLELIKININIQITPILVLSLIGLEMIDFYEHLLIFINKRLKWKSQFLES